LDRPTPAEVLLTGAWYLGLSAISTFYPTGEDQVLQLALVVGVGISIYFINRKEARFGRAVIFTLSGLIVGLIAGGLLANWAVPLIGQFVHLTPNQFSTAVTFVLLWLISSFLR
jgi:uncharacterized membrane protein YccC